MTAAVVISGFGIVSPLGASLDELTARFCAGTSALAPLPGIDGAWGASIGEIPLDVIPADKRTHIGRLDRLCRLFLSAAYLAVDAAQLAIPAAEADRFGLSFGTGLGCLLTNAEYDLRLIQSGPAAASPRLFAYTVSSAAAGEVSIALGIQGANVTAHAGFAAGLAAVGYGYDLIRLGKADVVLAGGADALGPAFIEGLRDMGVLKRAGPLDAVPFRDVVPGVFPSEGAVVMVLERAERARRRGAPHYGRIEGYAAGFEPTLTRHQRESTGIRDTMRRALAVSDREAADIDIVMTSAHATAVDAIERDALRAVFAAAGNPLWCAPKRAWGEGFAADGVSSLAVAAALLRGPLPPLAEGVALQPDGRAAYPSREAQTRLASSSLAMIHSLCYSGPTVALLLARDE